MMAHEWYSSYDALVSRVCPDYEKGLDAVVRGIRSNPKRILELASGTGNLTTRLAEAFPQAEITGIDKDESMLDQARSKLQQYKNIKLINVDILEFDVHDYDAIVSALVFHMLSDPERKQVLDRVYKSGAREITIFDRVKGETPEQEKTFLQYFAKQLNGKGLPNEIITQLVAESKKNNPMKLSEHRAICEANEFRFEVLYQNPNHGFVAYGGIRK